MKINKFQILFLLLTIILIFPNKKVNAEGKTETVSAVEVQSKKLDSQATVLAAYLANFDSPLQYHAQDFIDAAETYKLDWKMLPAIAGVESTFGKQIPGGFNAWGWGVYGTQAIYFNSWREAIFTIAKGLKEGYLDKGLQDPYSINRVYAASPYWGSRVSFFMQDLERFASNYEVKKTPSLVSDAALKIAATSGQLVLK